METFKSKITNLKRGEFETSIEFSKRIADPNAILSSIGIDRLYAFRMPYMSAKYDADSQTYLFEDNRGFCKETYSFAKYKGWFTCRVDSVFRQEDAYTGSNSYGASVTVKRIRGQDFALAIPKGTPWLSALLTRDKYQDFRLDYKDRLPVPLERARGLKELKLAVLFVGRIIDARIIEGRGTVIRPEIRYPTDMIITEDGVPFELKRIVYYVVQTGEILGQKEF